MARLKLFLLAPILALAFACPALAQLGPSTVGPEYAPNWYKGYVPTPYQWQLLWSNKLDYNVSGLAINLGGTGATNAAQALANLGGIGSGLNSGKIYVGNASNVATGVTPSGDLSMTNAGVFTVSKTGGVSFGALATLGVGPGLSSSGGNLGLSVPVTVARGGSNCTSASGTCLDNITGFSFAGLLKRTGAGAYSAAVSGTDFAPATTGAAILYGNGSGGFSSVNIGTGLSFTGGTLATSGGGVAGPGSSTNGYVPQWSGTGGATLSAGLPVATTGASTIVETDGSGHIASSLLSGSYTGIAGVGTLGAGVWSGTAVGAAYGGTGAATLAAHGLVVGNGTGVVNITGAGTLGQVLTSNGPSADPTFQTAPGSWIQVTRTALSGQSIVSFTGIPQTGADLLVVFNNVVLSGSDIIRVYFGDATPNYSSAQQVVTAASTGFTGSVNVKNYTSGVGSLSGDVVAGSMGASPSSLVSAAATRTVAWLVTGGLQALKFDCASASTFSSGTITLYRK